MTFCFEKVVGFIRIISDGLERKAVLKNSAVFLILLKLHKITYFFLFHQIIWMLRLRLEEVIMVDRHMSDEPMYSFLQLFFDTEKTSLNWSLDSTVTDYVLLIFIVAPLW